MSFQAMAWAAERKWGSTSARSLIYAIANHANDNWFCFCKQKTLKEESEQSLDSVQRRLDEMVAAGHLRCIPLKRHGRRDMNFLILSPSPYFSAPIEQVEPFIPRGFEIMWSALEKPSDDVAADCGSVKDEESAAASAQVGEHAAVDCGNATLPHPAVHATALVRQQEPDLNQEDSPQSPPLPETPAQAEPQQGLAGEPTGKVDPPQPDPDALQRLAEFRSAYPEPSNKPALVRERFLALTATAQAKALRAARGLREVRRKNPRKAIIDQAKFLADPALWDEYARFAPYEPLPPVFVEFGSPEWRAVIVARAIAGLAMPPAEDTPHGCGRMFRGSLPAGAAGLAAFSPLDRSSWQVVPEADRQRFAAWAERVREWTGSAVDARRIFLDTRDRPVERAEDAAKHVIGQGTKFERLVPRIVTGLLVPCEWPPPKHGQEATGPPADDIDESAIDLKRTG